VSGVSIVVEDALAPRTAKFGVFAARENGGVLYRDATLIVITVEGPGLQLAAREFSFVHQEVERMLMMIALLSDSVKARHELGFREKRF
jgi:hypothetical protein